MGGIIVVNDGATKEDAVKMLFPQAVRLTREEPTYYLGGGTFLHATDKWLKEPFKMEGAK